MRNIRDDDMIGRGSQGEDGGKREKEMRMEYKGRGCDRTRRKGFAYDFRLGCPSDAKLI